MMCKEEMGHPPYFQSACILSLSWVLTFPVTSQADHVDKSKLACTTQCTVILYWV